MTHSDETRLLAVWDDEDAPKGRGEARTKVDGRRRRVGELADGGGLLAFRLYIGLHNAP